MIDAATRDLVRRRAGERCEYCRLRQVHAEFVHHVEHIVARQHGGSDEPDNLALCCARCNLSKGPNLTGVDPLTNTVAPLFHPRRDVWQEHFSWSGPRLVGQTPSGRATVATLAINQSRRLEVRTQLIAVGVEL